MLRASSPPVRQPASLRSLSLPQEALARLFLLLALAAALWAGLAPAMATPAVVPASAPATVFSAERALADLTVVAAEPHPLGAAANAAVRDYLVAEMRGLGLAPEVQRTALTRWGPQPGNAHVTTVENVMVRVPGTDSSRAIVVEGHYDSVPTAPGATDCGSCVVTVLESLRAVLAGPPLKNDVIFLFTDGEELFIAGAEAFMQQHPWAADVGLTLVFEGHGTHGASRLYAASDESGWWVNEALAAAPGPLGYSFINDLMWNVAGNSGSNLDAFIRDGQAGLAYIYLSLDAAPAYHTALDSLATIDPESVQHHGDTALNLIRHFGNLALDEAPAAANAVYFPLLPGLMARYPGAWAAPLAYAALLGYMAVAVLGLRRGRVTFGGLLAAVGAFLLQLIAAVVLVTAAWWLLRRVAPGLHMVTAGGWYGGPAWLLALLGLAAAGVLGLHLLWRRRLRLETVLLGALAWWGLAALAMALWLPGFSYMFVWPLLAALAVLGWSFARPEQAARPWGRAMWTLPAVAGVALLATVIALLFFFAQRLEALAGLPVAALPIPFFVLLLALLLPVAEFLLPARRWLPVAALLAAAAFLLLAMAQSGYDEGQPGTSSITYWLDKDAGAAEWITVSDAPPGRVAANLDEWSRQFFPNGGEETTFAPFLNGLASRSFPALRGPAPAVELPTSSLTLLEESGAEGVRRLRLQVETPEGVLDSQVIVAAAGPISALAVDGEGLDMAGQSLSTVRVSIIGRQPDGVTLELAAPAGPVTVTVQDRRMGLPEVPDFEPAPRPAWLMAAPVGDVADSTVVERSVTY